MTVPAVVVEGIALRWSGPPREWTATDRPGAEPLVFDSWLVDEGRVRALDLHLRRFRTGCRQRLAARDDLELADLGLEAAVQAVPSVLSTIGRWFPRLALGRDEGGRGELRLWQRPAPPRPATTRVWICDRPDARRMPRIKGADQQELLAARRGAIEHGADEALLVGPDGRLREAAFGAVLWWAQGTLCALPDDAPVLDSVTRRLLIEAARAEGYPVRFACPTAAQLDGCEVWVVSALHGIRAVTPWPGQRFRPGPALRATRWNARLARYAVPVAHRHARPVERAEQI